MFHSRTRETMSSSLAMPSYSAANAHPLSTAARFARSFCLRQDFRLFGSFYAGFAFCCSGAAARIGSLRVTAKKEKEKLRTNLPYFFTTSLCWLHHFCRYCHTSIVEAAKSKSNDCSRSYSQSARWWSSSRRSTSSGSTQQRMQSFALLLTKPTPQIDRQ